MIFRKLIDRGLHPVGGLPATHVCRNRTGEAPLGEAPLGEAPLGEAPLGEAPLGEAPLGEAPLTSAETLRDRCTKVCSL
jgi:hypothetical protein